MLPRMGLEEKGGNQVEKPAEPPRAAQGEEEAARA